MNVVSRFCVLAVLMSGLQAGVMAQSLSARLDGDRLRIGVENVPFLTGDSLRRLHDGGSVVYNFRITALTSRTGSVLAKSDYRFVISYDIFEEKFQVSRIRPTARVVSHLTQSAAEALCIESLELPVPSLSASRSFWLRLEYEAEVSPQTESSGVSLGGLVEVFSRKPATEPSRGVVEVGPLLLSNLPRSAPARAGTNQ